MSDEKSDEAIIVVANDLFGRKHFGEWRKYTPNKEVNINNLPAHSNTRCVEVQMVAMLLHLIVEELITGSACVLLCCAFCFELCLVSRGQH